LTRSLVEQKNAESRAGMEKLVQNFLKSNAADFIDSRNKVDPRFIEFYETVSGLDDRDFTTHARTSFIRIFDSEPQRIISGEDFRQLAIKITDSIIIAAIDQSIEAKVRSLLMNIAKTLGLIPRLGNMEIYLDYSKADFNAQIILLPEGIFPLPSVKQDLTKLEQAEKERLAKNDCLLFLKN
jgi:hypothetical protein